MSRTVSALDSAYPINTEHTARFARDGFIHLPEILPAATVAAYEPEISAQVVTLNTEHRPLAERSTFKRAFLQVMNLWRHSESIRRLVFSRRLAQVAAQLLDVASVRLYHDQALYKEPGGGPTPWHADQYYWPFDSDRTCTLWLPLHDVSPAMGPLSFATGSHRLDLGRDQAISDESEKIIQANLANATLDVASEPFAIGDASVHQGWTFHRAEPNTTNTPRRVLTIIYLDADITVAEPTSATRSDFDRWLPGATVGGVPDTHLNPTLWPPRP